MSASPPSPLLPSSSTPGLPLEPVDGAPRHAYVGVAVDLPLDRLFTYRVPEAMHANAAVGHRVRVPFRNRTRVGFVVERQMDTTLPRILDLTEAPDNEPTLTAELLDLGRFVARYYGASLGEALSAMVPHGVRHKGKGAVRVRVTAARPDDAAPDAEPERPTPAQQRVLRLLRLVPEGLHLTELLRRAGVSRSPVTTLTKQGWVATASEREPDDALVEAAHAPTESESPHDLTDAQDEAMQALLPLLDAQSFATALLFGVTGSGKTEIYLRALERCRAQGRQAIVLVPEIALTPQTVRRFRRRFARVEVLHSGMTEADRAHGWRRIRAGEADVVIGPRSAVFAPVPRLGLIVVDEEQEGSFKQQHAPRYHARDVGVVRARAAGAVVLLGSATPALETWHNAQAGRYHLLTLPDRVGGRQLPDVQVVDMRDKEEGHGGTRHIGRTLALRLEEALTDGGQVILFQNRRGFATSVSCSRCGHVLDCPHCSVGLTYHRHEARALCHLCGFERRLPRTCPECALPALDMHGVGTQTVEDELHTRWPTARIARMDSDTMTHRDAYEQVLGRFANRDLDVLLGTQMIAKGLDFPGVTLVGIVSADTSLTLPDFRSSERTFSLLAQVAGRAGRGDRLGRVVIQTRMPDHPAIQLAAKQDFTAFASSELPDRERFGYPPHRRLLRVVLRGVDVKALDAEADAVQARVVGAADATTQILGPAAPPIERIQGRTRRHLLIKAKDHRGIGRVLAALKRAPRPRKGIEVAWDVDPVSLF